MVMYANEFETKENYKLPKIKKGTATYLTLIKLRDIGEKIASSRSRIAFFYDVPSIFCGW